MFERIHLDNFESDPGPFPVRTEMCVLPGDKITRPIGWTIRENLGISIINDWAGKPWYRKIFHKRFWLDPFRRVFHKHSYVQYTDSK